MTRVLVVEDSATQAEQLRLILESEGYEVETALDGAAGFDRLHRTAFDLVISDIVMPELSGYDLCRKIKADPSVSGLPVILLTTLSDPLDIIQGLESGADNFLTKPYEPVHLLARVASILESGRLRRSGALRVGVEILFLGRKFLITSDRQQVLDLLVSTFEDVVRKNRELLASKAALEAANRELEAFTYSVSHDLRAPVRSIDGFSQILLEDYASQLDDKGQEHLARIRRSAQRMGELIEDLLRLSRLARGEIQRTDVDLSRMARSIADELRASTPARSVNFVISDDIVAHGDANLLRIVLDNLLGNAWKFTVHVSARIEVGSTRGGEAQVYFVRDNGAGFDMKHASKLFGPFQRLHREDDFPGTGIGLATVQRIIHRHGGRVWADGAVGRGATIYFTLDAV
jgi:two-component system, sensor histidine kinase and response regulator